MMHVARHAKKATLYGSSGGIVGMAVQIFDICADAEG
jgi:hypothetical protein